MFGEALDHALQTMLWAKVDEAVLQLAHLGARTLCDALCTRYLLCPPHAAFRVSPPPHCAYSLPTKVVNTPSIRQSL